MNWDDAADIQQQLTSALNSFDWQRAARMVGDLVSRIRYEAEPLPDDFAQFALSALRHKRQTQLVAELAEAMVQAGNRTSRLPLQYAQALIELGLLMPAERLLQSLLADVKGTPEEYEVRGLIGRVHKQIYVNSRSSGGSANGADLFQAIDLYLSAYREAPAANSWHGINVVALSDLALRAGFARDRLPDSEGIAKAILKELLGRWKLSGEREIWDLATGMEAQLALRDDQAAVDLALAYTGHRDANAFHVGATLRQIADVWGLDDSKSPGTELLPLLRAALLRAQGGVVRLNAADAEADSKPQVTSHLQSLFGADRCRTLEWYQLGLKRARSVARIEGHGGQRVGTGWLVKGGDFFPDQAGKLLLLTNAHVISKSNDGALRPEQARARFYILKSVVDVDQIVWSSPPGQYDATFVSLKSEPKNGVPLDICDGPIKMADPAPRVYIIGYPGGRDIEFSLDDCYMLATNDRVLHYRTPTEPGSSGSPVFEGQGWTVIGLHHAGASDMPRLDGDGTYEANEGISIDAIRRVTLGRSVASAP
jgi:hypothetical protein